LLDFFATRSALGIPNLINYIHDLDPVITVLRNKVFSSRAHQFVSFCQSFLLWTWQIHHKQTQGYLSLYQRFVLIFPYCYNYTHYYAA
jgi:hypothetical protein